MLAVKAHDRSQQDGVGDAVCDVVLAAQRIAQSVDCGGAGSGDGQTAVVSCDLHPVLLGHGIGVIAGFLNVVQDEVEALQSVQVAEGVGLVAGEALDAVCQSINAGSSCDLAGQVLDHTGVEDDVVRDHVLVDDADLQLLLGNSDDGVGSDLSAGAGGGGDKDDGDALLSHTGVVQQLLDAVVIGHQHACQFGCVHDGAAAAGHDEVGTGSLELIHQLLDSHVAGFGRQLVQNIILCAGSLHSFLGQGEQASALNALVGEHCHLLCTTGLDDGGDVVHCVLAAVNCVRHLQIVLGQHNKFPPSKKSAGLDTGGQQGFQRIHLFVFVDRTVSGQAGKFLIGHGFLRIHRLSQVCSAAMRSARSSSSFSWPKPPDLVIT